MIRRIESAALLVRSVAYGEADIIATFFTPSWGKLSAVVRNARRSTKRFGGALEPLHEIHVVLEDRGKELCVLKEARVERPRVGIASSLEAMEAAGQALRWVRHLCPARTPEPAAWRSLEELLEALNAYGVAAERDLGEARAHLALFGLRLLADMGYALEFDQCIRCGLGCPEGRAAFLDAPGGGIICSSCGGAVRTIGGALRAVASRAQRGEAVTLSGESARELIAIAEEAMAAHAGFSPSA